MLHVATEPLPTVAVGKSMVARSVDRIGSAALACVVVLTILSPLLMAIQPETGGSERQRAYFARLADAWPFLPGIVLDTFRSRGPLSMVTVAHAAYAVPLFAFTLCAVALLRVIRQRWRELTDADANRMFRWAIALALASAPAYTVLFQDIWLSVVWGRMANAGLNPYAMKFPLAFAADLPLDHPQFAMTYGPLWALIASAVTYVLGDRPLLAMLALKLVLTLAWVACLWLVADLTRGQAPWRRCLAIAVTGWLPVGVHYTVSEAHNDVVMVAFMLLWMRLMRDAATSLLGPLALAASVASKYVTAPLALLDVIVHWHARQLTTARYLLRIAPALLLMLGTGAFLVYSSSALHETSGMREGRFLDPADPFHLLQRFTGSSLYPVGRVSCLAFFGGAALVEVARLMRAATAENLLRAQLSIMATVMLVGVGHVWPWFFIWCLPLAAMAPAFWLSWFIIGAGVVAPFTVIHWSGVPEDSSLFSQLPALAMYGVAACAVVEYRWARRRITGVTAASNPPVAIEALAGDRV
jgi:hypothetical protein